MPTENAANTPAPASARLRRLLALALVSVASVALVLHMRVFNFVTDDAFISFVYSRNLVEHGQLVFNLGERVEGYTNFLWTLFLAFWMKLGWQPESSSIVFGVAFAVATMFVCALILRRGRGAASLAPWDALPALVLASLGGYACWSSGGLETQMFTFFVTAGSALYLHELDAPRPGIRGAASGLLFGLAALTRPEGNLIFALAALHRSILLLRERRFLPNRRELLWGALYLVIVVPHFLWRHHYYGWWLPNTFYIKSSGGMAAWGRGFYYLRRAAEAHALWAMAALAVAGLIAARSDRAARRVILYALLIASAFSLYIVSVGGDFMGLFRFSLPMVPLLVCAAVLGLRALLARARTRPFVAPTACALLLGALAWHAARVDRQALTIGADNGIDTPGFLRYYTADRAAIGKWFGRYAKPDDYAAVGGAGAQVYYSGMRSLDCFGLSDEFIAHKTPPLSTRPGHQKYAPIDYVLSRKPTIITSDRYHIGGAPLVREDAPFWRSHGYHYVSVEVPGLSAPWYTFLKRMDRSIGPLPAINGEID